MPARRLLNVRADAMQQSIATQPGPPPLGDVLGGKYRLVRLLGQGGMGSVYLGEHVLLGKRVALKLLHPEYARHAEAIQRFYQEAQAAAAVGHRGIVDVNDVGQTAGGSPFLVMELLEGASLSAVLKEQGQVEVETVLEVAIQVASALVAVHAKQIVHRDLKPENIFVTSQPDGRDEVKLLDFGISKVVSGAAAHLTHTGTFLGTPHFMAPEQARGSKDIDFRVDLWALGAILYCALTGRLPYEGDTYNEVLAKILTKEYVHPRSIRPELPEPLEKVVLRAMARDRKERYDCAQALLDDLKKVREETDLAPRPRLLPNGQGGSAPSADAEDVKPTVAADSGEMETGSAPNGADQDDVPTSWVGVTPALPPGQTPLPMTMMETSVATPPPTPPTPAWAVTPPGGRYVTQLTPVAVNGSRRVAAAAVAALLVVGFLGAGAWLLLRGVGVSALPEAPRVTVTPAAALEPPVTTHAALVPRAEHHAYEQPRSGGASSTSQSSSPDGASALPTHADAGVVEVSLTVTERVEERRSSPRRADRGGRAPTALTSAEIRRVLRELEPRLQQCIAQSRPAPAVVRVRVSIDAAGAARFSAAAPAPPPAVASCLQRVMSSASFRPNDGGVASFVYAVRGRRPSRRVREGNGGRSSSLRPSPFAS